MIGLKLLDRYQLVDELGRGGMGVVYRAHDPVLHRDVAVKMIPPTLLTEKTEERFQREAQLVAQMDHPAIVPIHDFGRHGDDGALFFVMPYVQGILLSQLIKDGELHLGEVLEIGIQVAEGLDYSHSRKVIHRDIKPGNIMVTREDGKIRARVMDFGLARTSSEPHLTQTGGLVGTLSCLSPEHVSSKAVDGRSDIYSLGTVLYECLSGQPLYSGPVHAVLYRIVHEDPQTLRSRGVEIDEELDQVILACLSKEPGQRPQRGRDLALLLARHSEHLQAKDLERSLTGAKTLTGTSSSTQLQRDPLVGRDQESALLQRRLNAAVAGECQLVLVGGAAGTGKSRLLQELEALARARQIKILRGRFADRESAIPYQGLCELIQDHFRGGESGGSATWASISGSQVAEPEPDNGPDLSDLAQDLVTFFPILSEVRELRVALRETEGEVPTAGTESTEATYLFELLARTLTRIAAGEPLLLLIENLHAGEVSIEALRYIVRRLGPTPTLILGTFRSEEIDRNHPLDSLLKGFEDDPRFLLVNLGPLVGDDFRLLAEQLIGTSALHPDLVMRLFEATEGNPHFTRELIRSLQETGDLLKETTGVWKLGNEAGISADALPVTIQQAVERRLEHLSEDLRRLLSTAAVLGKSFSYRDLEDLVSKTMDDDELDDAIEVLVRQGLLEEERKSREDRLHFASGVLREILYSELSRRKRRNLHRRHGEYLEKRYSGRLERVYSQLVHHFSEGDVPEKTVTYGVAQARRLLESFSPEESLRVTRIALDFVEEDEIADSRRVEAELRLLQASAYQGLGQPSRALKAASQSAEAYEELGLAEEAAGAGLLAAEIAWQGRLVEAARQWVERGVERARLVVEARGETIGEEEEATGEHRRPEEILRKLLHLGASLAHMRGEYHVARRYLEDAEQQGGESSPEAEDVAPGGVLRTALTGRLVTFLPGPMRLNEEVEVAANLYEPLLTADAEGNVTSCLSRRWDSADGGKTFELVLADDVVFWDGVRLTAAHVKTALEQAARRGGRDHLPAAFGAIVGIDEFLSGEAEDLSGIGVLDDRRIAFNLLEPLPLFPVLLTDLNVAVARLDQDAEGTNADLPVGTGPFLIEAEDLRKFSEGDENVILRRNEKYWAGRPPLIDALDFLLGADSSRIAEGLRRGTIDLGRGLAPEDLEVVLRNPQFRSGLVETTKKNVYFVLWNCFGSLSGHPELRRLLTRVLQVRDLVWRTLGRFAQPAVSLFPPGILGHDPGRRLLQINRDAALSRIGELGIALPIRLRAGLHPLMHDRYESLASAIFEEWASLGVEVEAPKLTIEEFLEIQIDPAGYDLQICRWNADFDDPDDFTNSLFNTRGGFFRRFYSSPEADELFEKARSERRSDARQHLYQKFENVLADQHVLLPLFHDVDYRIAAARLRGVHLRNIPPYVSYPRIGIAQEQEPTSRRASSGGELHVPILADFKNLDPAESNHNEPLEVKANVFETLTRIDDGFRVIPWLASFETSQGGKVYRFRLQRDLRFHDGRRCTARDVRYTFERVLQSSGEMTFLLLPIRGAREMRDGEATTLEGLEILSSEEFTIELTQPLAFFAAMLTHPGTAIVPEGTDDFGATWRDGCAGTGPYRVVRFEPGGRLDLERNPHYWRAGLPKSDRLSFHLGLSPETTVADFRSGRLSLASSIEPSDVEALRRDPEFARSYHESPRLSTYFLVLNSVSGPFQDPELRRLLQSCLDVSKILSQAGGKQMMPAHGLIPPGLLGYERPRGGSEAAADGRRLQDLEIELLTIPTFTGPYAAFWTAVCEALEALGLKLKMRDVNADVALLPNREQAQIGDVFGQRWIADYPDSDNFVYSLLGSNEGGLSSVLRNEELDRLIEAGRREAEPALRHAIYREIEELVAREAYLIPLFHEQDYRFCHPSVKGFRVGFSLPEVAYEELYLER